MKQIINEIKQSLDDLHDSADFTDIGNAIGLVIGAHEIDKPGFETEDFESGFEHGESIAKGTHG